jgi:hypothetical protein
MKAIIIKKTDTMIKRLFYLLAFCTIFVGCDRLYDTPTDDSRLNAGANDSVPKFYMDQYDQLKDEGQFFHPDVMAATPKMPITMFGLYGLSRSDRNNPNVANGSATAGSGDGLQYHLMSESFTGLIDKGVAAGKLVTGSWMDAMDGYASYRELQKNFKLSPTWLVFTGNPMTNPGFGPIDGGVMDYLGKKYVLTDVNNNPESSVVAVVASHVYKAFIIDVRDKAFYDANGFTMAYDATHKTTADSWNEFKDKCSKKALVVMPVQTGELADFAISNDLFVVNLNKKYNTSSGGQNVELFKQILSTLEPNSPVYGWEPGVGEDEFVSAVSQSGNMMVSTNDFNLPWFSKDYKTRQSATLAKIVDPHDIDYTTNKTKKFVSYYLSDGANPLFMNTNFVSNYYLDPKNADVNMGYGITASTICQLNPSQFDVIMANQPKTSTLIESFGGGYWYCDNFGKSGDRPALLKSLAGKIASHMRQHRIKVLEQIAYQDPKSSASMETYQALVDANDQLEGIVAIQYAPSYAGGGGEILWVTNKKGYDVPIVTVRYSIWNFGSRNQERDGTPTYVAHQLNKLQSTDKFSAVIVHAWSAFKDTDDSQDELAENASGSVTGASAAEMCNRRLNNDFEAVNMQELIWRIRMEYRPEQTQKYLNEYF